MNFIFDLVTEIIGKCFILTSNCFWTNLRVPLTRVGLCAYLQIANKISRAHKRAARYIIERLNSLFLTKSYADAFVLKCAQPRRIEGKDRPRRFRSSRQTKRKKIRNMVALPI